MSITRHDPLLTMPSAGNYQRLKYESMKETLTGYSAPPTPDKLKPYRSTGTAGLPGAQLSHYDKGTVFRVPDKRYGRQNTYDESTASRFAEMREPVFAPKTRPYASELREPLGKPMEYGFKLPDEVQRPEFRFGKRTVSNEPAKSVIYPPGGPAQGNPKQEAMYQTQRGYDWASVQIDPTEFRFGAVAKAEEKTEAHPTQIIAASTAEVRRLRNGDVGVHRITGVMPPMPPDHTFGLRQKDEMLSMKEVMTQGGMDPPSDIGTSTVRSATLRRLRSQEEATRGGSTDSPIFGMPSIRKDKLPPKLPGIASNTNFGDEPTAHELLFPRPDMAGAEAKVLATVTDAEILANRCKFGLTPQQVAQAYELAARSGPVTALAFTKAIDELERS